MQNKFMKFIDENTRKLCVIYYYARFITLKLHTCIAFYVIIVLLDLLLYLNKRILKNVEHMTSTCTKLGT